METIKELLKKEPQLIAEYSTFEALDILYKEEFHTKFIVWLLHPNGPLPNNIFLEKIFKFCFYGEIFPGIPTTISAEYSKGNKRVERENEWEKYILCIENKIKSSEGKNQIKDYLEEYKKPNKK